MNKRSKGRIEILTIQKYKKQHSDEQGRILATQSLTKKKKSRTIILLSGLTKVAEAVSIIGLLSHPHSQCGLQGISQPKAEGLHDW